MVYTINNEQLTRRKLVTIDGSMVTSETGIPLMLNINLSGVKTDGADVRLATTDGTPIAREIECTDVPNSDDVTIHYPFDTVASTDSQFYVYWGNAALTEPVANSTYGSEAVWDTNAVMVSLFNTVPSVEILDSSANGYDATPYNFVAGDVIDTAYGKGINMDGSKFMTFPIPITDISPIEITVVSYHVNGVTDFVLDTGWWMAGNDLYMLYHDTNVLLTGIRNGGSVYGPSSAISLSTGWHTATFKFDGSTISMFIDGVKDSVTLACPLTTITADDWYLGRKSDAATYLNNDISFISITDTTSHSDNYIITQHKNLNNPTATDTAPFYLSFGNVQHQRRTPQFIN